MQENRRQGPPAVYKMNMFWDLNNQADVFATGLFKVKKVSGKHSTVELIFGRESRSIIRAQTEGLVGGVG